MRAAARPSPPTARAASSVRASFEGVDAGGLLAIVSGNAVPLTGAATGTVDLRFPGTNFKLASGRVDANFEGATGRDESARTPLTGQFAADGRPRHFQHRAREPARGRDRVDGRRALLVRGRLRPHRQSQLDRRRGVSGRPALDGSGRAGRGEIEECRRRAHREPALQRHRHGRPRFAGRQRTLRASVAQHTRARPRRALHGHRLDRGRDALQQRPSRRA